MAHWNFTLFENFKSAAHQMGLEVQDGRKFYSIVFPPGVNTKIFARCWTPLNKMDRLHDLTPDRALSHIKDNQDDFHLEFSDFNFKYDTIFHDLLKSTSTVDDIKHAIKVLMDPVLLDKYKMLADIKYADE